MVAVWWLGCVIIEGLTRGRRVEMVGLRRSMERIIRGPPREHTYRELVCGVNRV